MKAHTILSYICYFICLSNLILANELIPLNSPNQHLIYAPGAKVLALIDDWNLIETHSLFWNQVRSIIYY